MYAYSPIIQAVLANGERCPEKIALVVGNEEIDYKNLCNNIKKSAYYLNNLGFKKGDRLILCAEKNPYFVYLYFASHLLGLINELSDPELHEETFQYDKDAIISSNLFESEISGIDTHDIVEILHTTGTTSKPKSVCLSHYNVYWAAKNTSDYVQNDENDVEVVVMPICHAFGLRRLVLTLMNGATAVLLPNFANVRLLLKTIEKYHVTSWGMAPSAWAYVKKISGNRISNYKDQIRHIEFGTAHMPLKGKLDVLEMLPNTRICHNYGLTESNRSAMLEYHDSEHLDSIGKPIADNVTFKIFDGEICVHGNQTMERYLDEEDNSVAFIEGFFRTGDAGYISDEGYIYLTGRIKDMISVGGKKVSPMEVEDVICSLGIGDCICASHSHELLGETVKAFILKGSTEMSLEEIEENLKKILPAFKCPTLYEWIDEIPLNGMGKKQRRVLINK